RLAPGIAGPRGDPGAEPIPAEDAHEIPPRRDRALRDRHLSDGTGCRIDPEDALDLFDTDPVGSLRMARDGVAPARDDLFEARTGRVGVAVHADDQATRHRHDVAHHSVD